MILEQKPFQKAQSTEDTEKIFTKRDIKKAEQMGLDFFTTVEEQKAYAFRDIEGVQDQLQEKNKNRIFEGKK